jgi:DNA-binding NarL/FixJ family response regulator
MKARTNQRPLASSVPEWPSRPARSHPQDCTGCAQASAGHCVLIADDHALFRDGLRSMLAAHGVDVVGEASNGREAVDATQALHPDAVLMDLHMPELDGLAAIRLISASQADVKVVVLVRSAPSEDTASHQSWPAGSAPRTQREVALNARRRASAAVRNADAFDEPLSGER